MRTVVLLRPISWRDQNNRVVLHNPGVARLPLAFAAEAIQCGVAVPTDDPAGEALQRRVLNGEALNTLREVGRIERTIFLYVTWNLSRSVGARRRRQDVQRRTTVGAMAGPQRRALGALVAEHAGGLGLAHRSTDAYARLVGVPCLLRRCRGRSADGQARARCPLRPPPDRAP